MLAVTSATLSPNSWAATEPAIKQYDIAAGHLSTVLNQFVQTAETQIAVDASQLQGLNSNGLKGRFSLEQGFQTILANSGFSAKKAGQGYVIIKDPLHQPSQTSPQSENTQQPIVTTAQQEAVQLAPLVVYGQKDRDTQGYDDVYDKNRSSVYVGKEYIERFKGTNPADLVQGMVGVYSGDARNSGALDPSVRGIQGVGRVPLTIDGTEQSIAVWRGYNGVNNRNYIDPNLIGGIEVIKGPSLEANATTSVGGGVLVKTLEAGDIVKPGKQYGAEIKIEGSSNAISPNLPTLQYVGQNYADTPAWTSIGGVLYDPDIYKQNRNGNSNDLFNGDDVAGRIALATKQDKFDLLAVYAERKRGNYFSGTNNAGFYDQAEPSSSLDYIPYFASVYKPGSEVVNTSSHMKSWLLKGTYRPTDDQSIKLIYRQTKNEYGEIMPSRITWSVTPETGVPQWPLSVVDSKAYSAEYKYNPENNKWINFTANIWQTDTESNTYTRGGWPTFLMPTTNIITNTAVANSDNTRKGFTMSNNINLLDNLDLTIGGSYLREKLSSDDEYSEHGINVAMFQALPRAGHREEKVFDFNFNYRPTNWLTLEAGMRYRNYWAFDDFLNENLTAVTSSNQLKYRKQSTGYTIEYLTVPETRTTAQQRILDILIARYQTANPDWDGDYGSLTPGTNLYNAYWSQSNTLAWTADSNGNMHIANNPLNDLDTTLGVEGVDYILTSATPRATYNLVPITEVKKTKAHAWAPQFSAAIQLNEHNRVYARYAEEYRMPSLFESTVGFSSNLPYEGLKPEHTFSFELGYIYDARYLFKTARNADIKLAYFHHKTKDVIERDRNLMFTNLEKQTLEGIELQSRYDNGRFFGDLSMAYNLKNKVCDENLAVQQILSSSTYATNTYQKCVDDGFPNGYLVTMATPEISFNGLLGARFFDEKLELGARATFYKKYESYLRRNGSLDLNAGYYLNVPLAWDDTWIFDAYANYQVNEKARVELIGTNLTNQFYIDPLSRSAMAAPGRTFKLAFTYNF
ncbi:outer membrane receptor protein [Acinetobacter qingfengensis]|uniref:Outer membrane receptor protein n=2 Tax=Acinetobacter qingfengensis TaxID=1262585 RepID=A0A1E7RA11_9GAMM|nr:TonB-dependent receptor [Acinetobacter qingfengensis]OEY96151.1 outer membrane receptor protein [Acinetobacter qingfengensis]